MSAGCANDIRKGIRNCREMEKLKKVTYGVKKTKYMVLNTGRDEEEKIEEEVKMGMIGCTDKYKYVGFNLDKHGNCLYHIDMKEMDIKGRTDSCLKEPC